MHVSRPFWAKKIEKTWQSAPIVWLAGVRRSGKSTLAKSFKDAAYYNCDLPSIQAEMRDPELFLKRAPVGTLIFDEIHQLPEASMLLKIAADENPNVRILATGSSTLVAGKKFKDTLTGRKREVHFLPVLVEELPGFKIDLERRILHGGLPPALLAPVPDHDFYAEWMDSFYARDIQELFAIEKRLPFLKALEYLLVSNSSLFELTKLAQASGVSRPTMIKYLEALEVTKAITVLRPFAKNAEQELVSQPKIYGFDTGFCSYAQGIRRLESSDKGPFLENLTLETFQAFGFGKSMRFWRTKSKKEIDFVLELERGTTLAIECKWKEKSFSDDAFSVFRGIYPSGRNWVITGDSKTRTEKRKNMEIRFIHIEDLFKEINDSLRPESP